MVGIMKKMVCRVRGTNLVEVESCSFEERDCKVSQDKVSEYTYTYKYLVREFVFIFPLLNFQCVVLCTLNCAPSQLHPNGWALCVLLNSYVRGWLKLQLLMYFFSLFLH